MALTTKTQYVDLRLESSVEKGGLFKCVLLCTRIDESGEHHHGYMLWIGTDDKAARLKRMADRAMQEFIDRGRVARI